MDKTLLELHDNLYISTQEEMPLSPTEEKQRHEDASQIPEALEELEEVVPTAADAEKADEVSIGTGDTDQDSELAGDSVHEEEGLLSEAPSDALVQWMEGLQQSISAFSQRLEKMEEQLLVTQQSLAQAEASICSISTGMRSYDDAVKTLKVSLSANQRNEQILHDKLDAVKKDEHYTVIRPFLEYMILQHMDFTRSKKNYISDREAIIKEVGEGFFQEMINLHDNMLLSLENQMSIHGMEIVDYLPETDYLPLEQNIVGFRPTEDPSMERKLAETKSFTYKYQGKVLRKASVICYKRSAAHKGITTQ